MKDRPTFSVSLNRGGTRVMKVKEIGRVPGYEFVVRISEYIRRVNGTYHAIYGDDQHGIIEDGDLTHDQLPLQVRKRFEGHYKKKEVVPS